MSDVLATNLMLTGLLFLFSRLLSFQDEINPAQVTLKYQTSQVMVGVSHPHFLNVCLGHVTFVISIPNYFFTSIRPLLITFATKFYLRSETYISYKFYARYHQKRDF